jgi:ParB family chromosome partitioning protein
MTSTTTKTTRSTPETVAPAPVQVEHLDPTTLLVDVNVRHDTRLDPAFLGSVADLGVLVPIVAVRTSDGGVRVRYGHRRTLAAIEANRPTVPVVIVGTDDDSDATHVARIVAQHAENEHRAGLTNSERADVVHQLHAFGVSAAQIVKRTKTPREQVDAALVVSGSTLAREVTARYDFLDLLQVAVVAEFEDDTETVEALLAAAQTGRFDHVAQRARAQRVTAFTAEVVATGASVLDPTADRLRNLRGTDGALSVEEHAQCPGHGVVITTGHGWIDPATGFPPTTTGETNAAEQGDDGEDFDDDGDTESEDKGLEWGAYPEAVPACADATTHGHEARWATNGSDGTTRKVSEMSDAEAEAVRAARRDVIDLNKAWKSAEVVRREHLRSLLTRRTVPKGAAALVATALATYPHAVARDGAHALAADLLGCEDTRYTAGGGIGALVTAATEGRAQVLTLALVLAGFESSTHVGSWRHVDTGICAYLGFLESTGYVLSDVERRACGQDPLSDTTTGEDCATGTE